MSKEEPAWRAELMNEVRRDLVRVIGSTKGAEIADFYIGKYLERAEEGGRREALKQHVSGLKADWGRLRGRVLQEAWEALRDAEGGPLIDAMSVINRLLESP